MVVESGNYTLFYEEGNANHQLGTGVFVYRRIRTDNIRMELEEIGINAGNWVDSAQDRDYWRALVNAALNLRVP